MNMIYTYRQYKEKLQSRHATNYGKSEYWIKKQLNKKMAEKKQHIT